MDTLEWLSRYANFYNPENVYLMIATFKEIYSGADINYRNAYIAATHASDTAFVIIAAVKGEISKILAGSGTQKGMSPTTVIAQMIENKIAFLLNLLEPLLVNDLNNEVAIQAGIIEELISLSQSQGKPPALRAYLKFTLRCLTSAIRTEAAVSRVSSHSDLII